MYQNEFKNYLIKRRDVLARQVKLIGFDECYRLATHASATPLDGDGEQLTLTCRLIGQALAPDANDKAQVKLGGRWINFLHINGWIDFTQLSDDSWRVFLTETNYKDYVQQFARKKRIANITVKPEPWHKPFNKGVPIVKRLKTDDMGNYTIDKMPNVYKALNTLQDTRWTVNSAVLELMQEGVDNFSPMVISEDEAKAARKKLMAHKAKSLSLQEWLFTQNADRKRAKVIATDKFKSNSKDVKDIVAEFAVMESFIDAVELAMDVEHEDLYFQHNCCSRGRLYSLSSYLSPQGPDYQKALLRFSEPGPVCEDWIKIHIANCAGKDKLSYQGRIDWVDANESSILGVANDINAYMPWLLENGIHREKKTKWQFIASCIEYNIYKQIGMWTIPVGVDATSSGLQFLSAIAKDDSVAEDVNISSCSYAPVGDLYQKIGDAVVKAADMQKAPSLAHLKPGDKSLRKLCKRSTMTFAYSCQGGSMGEHTHGDRSEYGDEKLAEMSFTECSYLGHLQYEVIKQELPKAAAVMKAMQDCFKGYSGASLVSWRAPTGFLVYQDKPAMSKATVSLEFDKRARIRVVVYTATTKASVTDHKMAISPNVVHCLDASMMVDTICKMADSGVTQIQAVHDQYASYPGQVELLGHEAREAFYDIVKNDPVKRMMDEAVPNMYVAPEQGSWDAKSVLTSAYFLC